MLHPEQSKASGGVARGFTLIELLVVIAIIAILAAILFPVFARARENARRASCQSNLKQLTLAIVQYTQDYDERHPGFKGWDGIANVDPWGPTVQPYLKSQQVLQCPSRSRLAYHTATTSVHYMMNGFLGCGNRLDGQTCNGGYADGGGCGQECGGLGVHNSNIPRPSQTILTVEDISTYDNRGMWHSYTSGNEVSGYGFNGQKYGSMMQTGNMVNTHLEGMNLSFVDGHVKWYPAAKLKGLGVGSTPFCGRLNGTGNYDHNGDIDMQYRG